MFKPNLALQLNMCQYIVHTFNTFKSTPIEH